MPRMTGARHFAQAVHGYGVTHVFFVPAVLLTACAEMEDLGIRRVMTHGEKAAAYMADGYARASGRPGLCMAQNIGASNLAAGLRDARMACAPVIAVTGGPTAATRHRNYYQEIDDFAQFDPVTKFNARVDSVERLPDLLRQAFREATSGAPGPVHLEIGGVTGEIIDAEAELELVVEEHFTAIPAFRPEPEARLVQDAADRLLRARRPIIVAGGGVVSSGAQAELLALAERLDIPVATSLNAKGVIPDTHPLSVGVAGTYSRACANRAVSEADLVFFVGSRTGGQVTTHWSVPAIGTPVLHLDINASELGRNYPGAAPLPGDAKLGLQRLLEALGTRTSGVDPAWPPRVRDLVAAWRAQEAALLESDAVPMRPERICRAISEALPEGGILVSDTGHSGMWSGTMVDFTRPGQRYLRCAGSLGWALPAAIGAKLALPDRPVLCFTGDGAAYYHVAELETAARYGANVVFVVNDNSALNQEIELYDRAYGGTQRGRADEMWRFRDIDFSQVAEAFGCLGLRAETPAALDDALRRALAADRPVVIDAVSDLHAFARHAWRPGTGA